MKIPLGAMVIGGIDHVVILSETVDINQPFLNLGTVFIGRKYTEMESKTDNMLVATLNSKTKFRSNDIMKQDNPNINISPNQLHLPFTEVLRLKGNISDLISQGVVAWDLFNDRIPMIHLDRKKYTIDSVETIIRSVTSGFFYIQENSYSLSITTDKLSEMLSLRLVFTDDITDNPIMNRNPIFISL